MMTAIALPQRKGQEGLVGTLHVPGDKSLSHRALMLGALAVGDTVIDRCLLADDVLHTRSALTQLGTEIDVNPDQQTVVVHGRGRFAFAPTVKPIDLGNAGTATRLLLGMLSRQPYPLTIHGDASLSQRPLMRVCDPLQQMGATIDLRDDNYLPASIHANSSLKGITYQLPVASAQVKSAILLAGLQAQGTTSIIEPVPTRDHTERLLRAFGADIERQGKVITLQPGSLLEGQSIQIPGDLSSAAFFIVAALIIPGSHLVLPAVGVNPTRTGLLTILEQMGAKIGLSQLETLNGEPRASLTIKSQSLKGITIAGAQVALAIDELPIIALAATQAKGETIIRDAQELRFKETDRIKTVVQELKKFGVHIEEKPDGMVIKGQQELMAPPADTVLHSHGDHRLGMMLAVAALLTGGKVLLKQAEAIGISYPTFLADLQSLLKSQ